MKIRNELSSLIKIKRSQDVLIHSDILFGFKIKFDSPNLFLQEHMKEIMQLFPCMNILMPAFNYNFCRGSNYNIHTDESQVGVLSEYFRTNQAEWRTLTPVFNFSGTGNSPVNPMKPVMDPFDESSVFGQLYKNKGLLMHYGSNFNSTTLLHFAERISGKLIYRYNKSFKGIVITDNNSHNVELIYHVRPKDRFLEYEWQRIETDLVQSGIIHSFTEGRTRIILCRVDDVVNFWLDKLNKNPFYFLNSNTLNWVLEKYNELKRPFIITDFE